MPNFGTLITLKNVGAVDYQWTLSLETDEKTTGRVEARFRWQYQDWMGIKRGR